MTTITIDTDDITSIAAAIAAGITTPEIIADYLGLELVDDCVMLDESPIYCGDNSGCELEYPSDTAPREAARKYVESGAYTDFGTTTWITVYTYRYAADDCGNLRRVTLDRHTVTIQPQEPECDASDEHEWSSPHSIVGGLKENPGVWGHGGGIICKEVCQKCGCGRTTDTWAQNSDTGEQGLRSVSYQPREYLRTIDE